MQNAIADRVDPQEKWLYRLGGISCLVFGIGYIIIIALYIPAGAPPSGAEARLQYHAGNTSIWWAILGLSVLTDLLLVPVALSLYLALKRTNRSVMLLATVCVGLFIVLDLGVTWTNYAALITLSSSYAAATDSAQKAVILGAATYPSVILDSGLLFFYNTFILSVGILLTGLVMLKGVFNKATAYLGIATGIFGIVAVVGPFLIRFLSGTILLASVLTLVWVLFIGHRLFRM